MFDPISYLTWMHGRPPEATHNLGSSDLRPTPRGDGVVPEPLDGQDDPPADTDLESQLAAEYDVAPERVLVTSGATHANVLAAAAAIDRRLERSSDLFAEKPVDPQVVVETPGYEPLVATPEALGARVDRFQRPPGADYRLSATRVADAATEALALATVTDRHNPSGRLADPDRLADVAEAVADRDGLLLVDEVYAPYVTDPDPAAPFGGPSAVDLPNTLVSGSLTKFHGLGDIRVGWLVGPEEVVARARGAMTHLPFLPRTNRALARRALAHERDLADDARALVERNGDLLASFVEARDDLHGRVFPGSTFAFLAHGEVDGDAVAAEAWERGVLVVPGRFFGRSEAVRVSLGRDTASMREGLDAFGAALDAV
ncbi:MAG: pyridoxal phosphate-dependent aminotransferase [Haloferacaceae archaeon]